MAFAGVAIGAVLQMPLDPALWWTGLTGALIGGLIGAVIGKLLPAEKRSA